MHFIQQLDKHLRTETSETPQKQNNKESRDNLDIQKSVSI